VARFRCRTPDVTHVFTPSARMTSDVDGSAVTASPPPCTTHGSGTEVIRYGTYGKGVARRQRFLCRDADGETHTFTPALPRHRVETGHCCAECDEQLPVFRGPAAPARGYVYTARDVARVLVRLGSGDSYQSSAELIRKRWGRSTGAQEPNWRLAGDWCEVFGPVAVDGKLPTEWPRVLVLDHIKFRLKLRRNGKRISGGRSGWVIFCAAGHDGATTTRLVSLRAGSKPSQPEWAAFLRSMPGVPDVVVGDGETASRRAVEAVWGTPATGGPVWVSSSWHLRKTLRNLLRRKHGRDDGDPVVDALEWAFRDEDHWLAFLTLAHESGLRDLRIWLLRREDELLAQMTHVQANPGWSRASGALESQIRPVQAALEPRRGGFRNKERTQRLLDLMLAYRLGLADELAYAHAIREASSANHGFAAKRRAIVGKAGGFLR